MSSLTSLVHEGTAQDAPCLRSSSFHCGKESRLDRDISDLSHQRRNILHLLIIQVNHPLLAQVALGVTGLVAFVGTRAASPLNFRLDFNTGELAA